MVSFAVFAAILLAIVIAALGGLLSWTFVAKRQFKVGDIVRTSFTGCPTVLTTALWGVNADYLWRADPSLDTYGFNGSFDAGNALHCDVHGAAGTYSTWLQSSGANFKNMIADHQERFASLGSGTNRFFTRITCTTDADCVTNTQIPCGPTYIPPVSTSLTWDINNFTNPDIFQCPPVSRCSLLDGLEPGTEAWRNVNNTTEIGVCKASEGDLTPQNLLQTCTQIFPTDPLVPESQLKYCNSYLIDPSIPPADMQRGCLQTENYGDPAYCNPTPPNPRPFYCNFAPGNAMCLLGQSCTTNTGATQVWSNNYTDSNICSGTVLPDIAIQLDWIAEGTISRINGNGASYNVDWHRVALQYEGIGPSELTCPANVPGKTDNKCKITPETRADLSWKYSDCRFILADDLPPDNSTEYPPDMQRHKWVKRALLGTPDANPASLGVFSNSIWTLDNDQYGFFLLSASLYVGRFDSNPMDRSKITTDTVYSGANGWRARAAAEYYQTTWNLSSINIPKENLSKIFFYSILPVDTGSETDAYHENSVAKALEMRATVAARKRSVRGVLGSVTGGFLYQ